MRAGQAIVLMIVLASLSTASRIKTASAQGIVAIRSDGRVDPPTAPILREGDLYTFTGNIGNPVSVEKSNIVIDGAGYTVEGGGGENGFSLYNMVNVTIKNANIKSFDSGVYLESSSNIFLLENNITENRFYGVWLYYSSNNTIVGNNLTHSNYGIWLYYSSDNHISGNAATDNDNGIGLYSFSNSNEVTMNKVSNNKMFGAYIRGSLWNVIFKNVFAHNSWGLYLRVDTNSNTISENIITENTNYGIRMESNSNHNHISRNEITKNHDCDIYLSSSSSNEITENNITNSILGMWLSSSDNYIYHNNFSNNTQHVGKDPSAYANSLDNGLEGNHWSNYTGIDADHDGIGDSWRYIDETNVDHYPLMGMFSDFNATSEYHVHTICSSSISGFQFNGTAIRFNVSGETGTVGFCRIRIPTALMNATYEVFVNGTEVSCNLLPCSNSTHDYLYFNYTHSTQEVIIIPEFPSFLILRLFMVPMLLAVTIYRRRRTVAYAE